MQPAWLENRDAQFWTLHLCGWMMWIVTFAAADLYEGRPLPVFWATLASAVVGAALTASLRYLYRAIWRRSPALKIPAMFAGSVALATMWTTIVYYGIRRPWFPELLIDKEKGIEAAFAQYMSNDLGYSLFLFLCWSTLYFGIRSYREFQEEQQRTLAATAAANEAQVRMLRYQLNPHFLFNALNGISTLIVGRDNDSANRMVNRLSRFLRYSLDKDPLERVDLDHELGALELYLEIEKVRFEERLRVVIDCDEKARHALIPSLLLQPLVENAIKYAIAEREEGGTITLAARVFGNELLLEFSDDGPGLAEAEEAVVNGRGVGLRNIRERLQQAYGEGHSFRVGQAEPRGLKVTLRIPFEKREGAGS